MKRNKILDSRKITTANNNTNYDICCPLCNMNVSYDNRNHTKSKKHILSLQKLQTDYLRENSPVYDRENVLEIV